MTTTTVFEPILCRFSSAIHMVQTVLRASVPFRGCTVALNFNGTALAGAQVMAYHAHRGGTLEQAEA